MPVAGRTSDALFRRFDAVVTGLLPVGAGIVVACSGGADSLALADMLRRLGDERRYRLCIAHFDHGIRGEESEADAAFVERVAAGWGVPFRLGRGDVTAYARQGRMSIETAARELRHSFLQGLADELGFDAIALGHHADDQAETVLMRVLRGTGLAGLSAMRVREGRLFRPLLGFRHEELVAYCREVGLCPREDATNAMPIAIRNRIRLELLPYLRAQYNPSISAALCRLGEWAGEAQDYLAREWERLRPGLVWHGREGPELSREGFLRLHPAIRSTVLRAFLEEAFGDIRDLGAVHFDSVKRLLLSGQTGERAELPGRRGVVLSYGWLRLAPCEAEPLREVHLAIPGWTDLPECGGRLYAELRERVPERTGPMEYFCDYDRLPEPGEIVVRGRRPGDRITGPGGTKKLKDLFIDLKLLREQRDAQPLLVCGECILWVVGLRRSRVFFPDSGTRRVLLVRAEGFGFSKKEERNFPS